MRKRGSKISNKKIRKWRTKDLIKIKKSKNNLELKEFYTVLLKKFGFQYWWPGESKFEIFVSAILTQQTSWKNVEKSIKLLKDNNLLKIEALSSIKLNKLENIIKSSGYYRQKAKKIKNICRSILKNYKSLDNLFNRDIQTLREILLNFNGIGRETADSIILYAAEKPIFVIDAYTKRIMYRVYNIDENIDYDLLRQYFEKELDTNLNLYKDIHAQFVALGKNYCKKNNPICDGCPLKNYCLYKKL